MQYVLTFISTFLYNWKSRIEIAAIRKIKKKNLQPVQKTFIT